MNNNDNIFLNKIWRNNYIKNYILSQIKEIGKLNKITTLSKFYNGLTYDYYSIYNAEWILKNDFKGLLKDKLKREIKNKDEYQLSWTKDGKQSATQLVFEKLNQVEEDLETLELIFKRYYIEFLDQDLIKFACESGNFIALKLLTENHQQFLESKIQRNHSSIFKLPNLLYTQLSLTKAIEGGHIKIVEYLHSKEIYKIEQFEEFQISLALETSITRSIEMLNYLIDYVGIDLKMVLLKEVLSINQLCNLPFKLFEKIVSIMNIPYNEISFLDYTSSFNLFSSTITHTDIQEFILKFKFIIFKYKFKNNTLIQPIEQETIKSLNKLDSKATKQDYIKLYFTLVDQLYNSTVKEHIEKLIPKLELDKIKIEYSILYNDQEIIEINIKEWSTQSQAIYNIYIVSFKYGSTSLFEKSISNNIKFRNLPQTFKYIDGSKILFKNIPDEDDKDNLIKIQFIQSLIKYEITDLSSIFKWLLTDKWIELIPILFSYLKEKNILLIGDLSEFSTQCITKAITNHSTKVLSFLFESCEYFNWNIKKISEVVGTSVSFECCKLLHQWGIEMDEQVMDGASSFGNFPMVYFLHYNGFKCTEKAYLMSLTNHHYNIFLFLINHRQESFNIRSYLQFSNHHYLATYCFQHLPPSRMEFESEKDVNYILLLDKINEFKHLVDHNDLEAVIDCFFNGYRLHPYTGEKIEENLADKQIDFYQRVGFKGYLNLTKKLFEKDWLIGFTFDDYKLYMVIYQGIKNHHYHIIEWLFTHFLPSISENDILKSNYKPPPNSSFTQKSKKNILYKFFSIESIEYFIKESINQDGNNLLYKLFSNYLDQSDIQIIFKFKKNLETDFDIKFTKLNSQKLNSLILDSPTQFKQKPLLKLILKNSLLSFDQVIKLSLSPTTSYYKYNCWLIIYILTTFSKLFLYSKYKKDYINSNSNLKLIELFNIIEKKTN